MSEQSQKSQETGEVKDLRNVLIAAGISLLCLAPMILLSGPIANVLPIPTAELGLVTVFAAIVTIGGLLALQINRPVRLIAWLVLASYVLFIALTVYFTGAPLTPMFVLYLLAVAAAAFLLGRDGATGIAALSIASYAVILFLEYFGIIKIIDLWSIGVVEWHQNFDPQSYLAALFFINWSAVTIPVVMTAQLTDTLASRLKSTNLQLRESEQLRTNLTDMLVHDLRNPLTALMGWLDIFRATMADQVSSDQYNLLENARRSGYVMLGLVGELLDVSKMEAQRLTPNFTPLDLCQLIADSVDSMRALIEIEGLKVSLDLCDQGLTTPCDKQLISRVLTNLISNAVKHTPPGGNITLHAYRTEDDMAFFSIADTGSGIPKEYTEHIFDKFGQVEQAGRERRGTGLGLTFCRMAVEAHQGRIWVESELGQGSTFSFKLPLHQPPSGT